MTAQVTAQVTGRRASVCRAAGVLAVLAVVGSVSGCSSDAGSAPSPPTTLHHSADCPALQPPVLIVDQIATAVTALEQRLGGEQQFFEINATETVVNLFVVTPGEGTEPATVTPYAYARGELTATDELQGTGSVFTAAALTFDPLRVLSCVVTEVSESTPEVFDVVADDTGAAHYSITTVSAQGGRLTIEVSPTGQVLSVDPV